MNIQANDHHLVMGELTDILTGQTLPDTHDERYRQKIAGQLINAKGYKSKDIKSRVEHVLSAGDHKAKVRIDFLISHRKRAVIMIKYAPGSLVTRRLSTLALSRTVTPYQIPYVIFTNGEDAEILDGYTGKVLDTGLDCIPDVERISREFSKFSFNSISGAVLDQASRIAFACEVDGACPCDTDVCIISTQS